VVETLAAAGIRHAFTVPGESFLGVLDALYDAPIRTIATRHEGGAGFMAEACGQLTGRPAVAMATRAVGAANLAIALHTARQDSAPLVALIGQVPRALRGREAFQEVDQVGTFGALCKAAVEIDEPERLASETARMIELSRSGRPGPVLISLPEDVLDAEVSSPLVVRAREPERPTPSGSEVDAVLDAIGSARAPVVVAGAGVRLSATAESLDGSVPSAPGASAALTAFVEATETPVLAAWRRPDVLANDHRLYLGMTGYAAARMVRDRLLSADLIVALGTRLSEPTSFWYAIPAANQRVIHVDLEPGFTERPAPWLAIRADAGRFLEMALERAGAGVGRLEDRARRRAANDADRAAYLDAAALPDAAARATVLPPPARGVDPAAVIRVLRASLPEGTIVTTDAGNFGGWAARHLPVPRHGRFLGPTSGAMGYALPAAIGAAIAMPERPVVALAGDGGFAMLMSELETAVRERARLTALVFDNAMYGTIRMHQEEAHPGRTVATNLGRIDFAAVAEACGARAWLVERDGDLDDAIADALSADGVGVVHVRTDPRVLSVDRLLVQD
jgi:acetolactate synthase I/II/III large subunit